MRGRLAYLYLVVSASLSPVNIPKLYVQVLLDFLCLTGFCLFVCFVFVYMYIHSFISFHQEPFVKHVSEV